MISSSSESRKHLINHMATYSCLIQIEGRGRDKSYIFDLAASSMRFSDSTVSKPDFNSLRLQKDEIRIENGRNVSDSNQSRGKELEILEKVQAVQQPRRKKVQALSDLTAETRQLPAGTALRLAIRCRCSRRRHAAAALKSSRV